MLLADEAALVDLLHQALRPVDAALGIALNALFVLGADLLAEDARRGAGGTAGAAAAGGLGAGGELGVTGALGAGGVIAVGGGLTSAGAGGAGGGGGSSG